MAYDENVSALPRVVTTTMAVHFERFQQGILAQYLNPATIGGGGLWAVLFYEVRASLSIKAATVARTRSLPTNSADSHCRIPRLGQVV